MFIIITSCTGSEAKECTCSALCANHLSSNGQLGYYYNNGACAQLTANCTVSNVKCVFDSRAVCESECFPCPPGSSKDKAGHCCESSHPHVSHTLTFHTPSLLTHPLLIYIHPHISHQVNTPSFCTHSHIYIPSHLTHPHTMFYSW